MSKKRMTYQEKSVRKTLTSKTPEDTAIATMLLLYCHIDLLISGKLSPKSLEDGKSSLQLVMMLISSAVLSKRMQEKGGRKREAENLRAATDTAKESFQKSFDRSLTKRYKSIKIESKKRVKQIQDWAHAYADAIRQSTLIELYESSVMAEQLFRKHYVHGK